MFLRYIIIIDRIINYKLLQMNFTFPDNMEEFKEVKGVEHLSSLIDNENKIYACNINYRLIIRKEKYLYAKCKVKNCKSAMNFVLV